MCKHDYGILLNTHDKRICPLRERYAVPLDVIGLLYGKIANFKEPYLLMARDIYDSGRFVLFKEGFFKLSFSSMAIYITVRIPDLLSSVKIMRPILATDFILIYPRYCRIGMYGPALMRKVTLVKLIYRTFAFIAI